MILEIQDFLFKLILKRLEEKKELEEQYKTLYTKITTFPFNKENYINLTNEQREELYKICDEMKVIELKIGYINKEIVSYLIGLIENN